MLLQDLPGALLRHILNPNSWCAIELWKCGNRTLNARLANNGVTRMELRDDFVSATSVTTSRWPRCISNFKLAHLSILRPRGPLGTPSMMHHQLKMLSSHLTSLEIHGTSVFEAFFPKPKAHLQTLPPTDSDGTEPPSKRAKSVEVADDNQLHAIQWNWDSTWPHLKQLTISSFWSSHVDSSSMSLLPRSLTLLRLKSNAVYLKADHKPMFEDLSGLPPGLVTLDLLARMIGPQCLPTLPKSLTDLGESLHSDAISYLVSFPEILPLLNLALSYKEVSDCLSLIQPGQRFPDSIVKLPLLDRDVNLKSFCALLPSKLTSLSLLEQHGLNHQVIAAFPRTLLKLDLAKIDWIDLRMEDWPPSLLELRLDSILCNRVSLLPRSLTTLSASIKRSEAPTAEEMTLLKSNGRLCLAMERDRWTLQKSTLLSRFGAGRCDPYIARVEDGELLGLPLGLTLFYSKLQFLLPPLIRRGRLTSIDDPTSLDGLPPCEDFHAQIDLPYLSKHLPAKTFDPTTTSLYNSNIVSCALHSMSPLAHSLIPVPLALGSLPRGLARLSLASIGLNAEDLQYLPPQLASLEFSRHCRINAPESDGWVELLPRSLIRLILPAATKLGGECIPKLPPKLTQLEAVFRRVNVAQARVFPPNLSLITPPAGGRGPFINYMDVLEDICRPFWRIREYSDDYLTSERAKISPLNEMRRSGYTDDIDSRTHRRFFVVE